MKLFSYGIGRSDIVCGDCKSGKQTKIPHKVVQASRTSNCFELLHMDLMGPAHHKSLSGKEYIFVVVDDFSRYTWVVFLANKTETLQSFFELCKCLTKEKHHEN